jgi:hypothetical protein
VLRYAPATGEVTVVADGLRFANGIALSADESHGARARTGWAVGWQPGLQAVEHRVQNSLACALRAAFVLQHMGHAAHELCCVHLADWFVVVGLGGGGMCAYGVGNGLT